ncbi:hypothetical protein [Microbulbifer litoralis]|uniref:hypothetical protein n=1 Tax=Microbulbifer litoralis TaxID=2933965 RepID=UPI002027C2EE|nr:hypothetical protein [Microbulbifer sp. GX H0434]
MHLLKIASGVVLIPLFSLFLGAGSAAAQITTLTCPLGTNITHYTPGITNTPKTTTFVATSVLSACTGLPLGISNAQITTTGFGEIGCNSNTATINSEILWSDGTESAAEVNNQVVQRPVGQVVVIQELEIVSGRFSGATLVRTLTLLQTDFDGCSSPEGVTSVAGPETLTMTNLL